MRSTLQRLANYIETPIVRWVSPILTCCAACLSVIVGYDFTELKQNQPSIAGVWDFLDGPKPFYAAMSALIALLLLSIFTSWRAPTRDRLKAERDRAREATAKIGENIIFLMEGLLLNLGRKMNFDVSGRSRVSLYVFESSQDVFVPCGRFSHNPSYAKKGRTKFGVKEGCIGKAWEGDWHFDSAIPEDKESANDYHKRVYQIPKGVSANLGMRSRLIAGKRVSDQTGRPIGVIVVESDEMDAFTEEELKLHLVTVAEDFGPIISSLRPYIPTPNDARKVDL